MSFPHEAEGPNGFLWNKAAKTYPSATKSVSKGGRTFTAIDAYAQIKRATEIFGPVGVGWGWDVQGIQYISECPHDLVIVHIALWYILKEDDEDNPFLCMKRGEFSSVGCATLNMQPRGKDYIRTDDDCVKKALTDAITKGLSYMGFNADVFFGAYDDNKYVQAMREEEAGKPAAQPEPAPAPAAAPEPAPEDGGPPWFYEDLGGDGKFSTKIWKYMTLGGVDGGRHKYLRWMSEQHRRPLIVKRVAWILSKFYGDSEAEERMGAGHRGDG